MMKCNICIYYREGDVIYYEAEILLVRSKENGGSRGARSSAFNAYFSHVLLQVAVTSYCYECMLKPKVSTSVSHLGC